MAPHKQTAERALRELARARRIPFPHLVDADGKVRRVSPVRLSHGKAAEMQRRGAVHFHVLVRLDGVDPTDPGAVLPPPAAITLDDLVQVLIDAAASTGFATPAHPDPPDGWPMVWGDEGKGKFVDIRPITLTGAGEVSDGMVAGYLAKYATKSTEATGHTSTRITGDNVDQFADAEGGYIARLIDACWRLGRRPRPHRVDSARAAAQLRLAAVERRRPPGGHRRPLRARRDDRHREGLPAPTPPGAAHRRRRDGPHLRRR